MNARTRISTVLVAASSIVLMVEGCKDKPAPTTSTGEVKADAAATPCEALRTLALPHVTVTEAQLVGAAPGPDGGKPLPAHCHVLGTSRPTADSEIRFEVDVPVGASWNGRYLQVGNAAAAGRILDKFIVEGLAAGYAVAGRPSDRERVIFGHLEVRTEFSPPGAPPTIVSPVAAAPARAARPCAPTSRRRCTHAGRLSLARPLSATYGRVVTKH